jgi:hypothetical protein
MQFTKVPVEALFLLPYGSFFMTLVNMDPLSDGGGHPPLPLVNTCRITTNDTIQYWNESESEFKEWGMGAQTITGALTDPTNFIHSLQFFTFDKEPEYDD